ncbi:hypothetical protein [Aeromonas sp. R6-2]|uniref:hypothetical protein n=1 Tax=Aeromonas sp. R6-2 TaxID=3138472 RepID=UPI0034A26A90
MIETKTLNGHTILLMDICTIGLIKDRSNILIGNDNRKKERLSELTELAKSKEYRFSFLLSIIEKATDRKNELTVDAVIKEFEHDWQCVANFVGLDYMREPLSLLKHMIYTLMNSDYSKDEWAELSLPNVLKLLDYYSSFKITGIPSQKDRYIISEKLVRFSKELEFHHGHIAIIICVAAIYGCRDAINILKIKNKGHFNASNCLGDIMTLYRVATVVEMLKNTPKSQEVRCIFRTENKALENLHSYREATCNTNIDTGETSKSTTIKEPERLFPMLFKKNDVQEKKEREAIYRLLNLH